MMGSVNIFQPLKEETVRGLVRRNYVPPLEQFPQISQNIREAREEIEALQTRLAELQRYESQQACLIAPIRRLPTELLQCIFASSSEPDPLTSAGNPLYTLTLSQVCSRWRDFVRSEPPLWCHLSVEVHEGFWEYDIVRKRIPRSPLLKYYLELSKNRPLHVEMTTYLQAPDGSLSDRGENWLQVLYSTTNRWDTFSVSSRLLENMPRMYLPTLRQFSILDGGSFHADLPDASFGPALESVDLGGYKLYQTSETGMDLSQIINLYGYIDHYWDLSAFLGSHNTKLKHLILRSAEFFDGHRSPDSSEVERSELTSLTDLHLVIEEGSNDFDIFPYLTLSSLNVLRLESRLPIHREFQWPHDSFLSMHSRRPFLLQSLIIHQISIQEQELAQVLRITPQLRRLSLRTQEVLTTGFIKVMAVVSPTQDGSWAFLLVPLLEELDLRATFGWGKKGDRYFLDMLERRAVCSTMSVYSQAIPSEGRSLRRVGFTDWNRSSLGNAELERVDGLRKDGILDVSYVN